MFRKLKIALEFRRPSGFRIMNPNSQILVGSLKNRLEYLNWVDILIFIYFQIHFFIQNVIEIRHKNAILGRWCSTLTATIVNSVEDDDSVNA